MILGLPYQAGIRKGDIILEINGKKIENQIDLVSTIEEAGLEEIELTLLRGKDKVKVNVMPIEFA